MKKEPTPALCPKALKNAGTSSYLNYSTNRRDVNEGGRMKVKVLKNYVDKDTKWLMEKGMTAEYEPERAEELISGGYVEEFKPKKKEKRS